MTIEYLSERLDDAARKRIADIFAAFERVFPDVCYVDRGKILGLGCPGLHLFCYYKIEQGEIFVKFKCSQPAVRLCDETVDFDSLIVPTIYLFQTEKFGKNRYRELLVEQGKTEELLHKPVNRYAIRAMENSSIIRKYLSENGCDERLFEEGTNGNLLCINQKCKEKLTARFSDDLRQLAQEYLDNQAYFPQVVSQTQSLIRTLIKYATKNHRDREIVGFRLGVDGNQYTLAAIGEIYGITRERVRQIVERVCKKMKRPFRFNGMDGVVQYYAFCDYLNLFSNISIDAFILYLQNTQEKALLTAFECAVLSKIRVPQNLSQKLLCAREFVSLYSTSG